MAPNPRRQDERLQALYDELPVLHCQGLCHDSCGPVEMSVRERARIERYAGRRVECPTAGAACTMLTPDRRCGVYAIRPMICRLWGMTQTMRCPYGCVPEGGFITNAQAYRLLAEADIVGGAPGGREQRIAEALRVQLEDPEVFERNANEVARMMEISPQLGARNLSLPRTILDV